MGEIRKGGEERGNFNRGFKPAGFDSDGIESGLTPSLELLVCLDRFSARRSLTVCFTLTPWYTRLLKSPETEANERVTTGYRWCHRVNLAKTEDNDAVFSLAQQKSRI